MGSVKDYMQEFERIMAEVEAKAEPAEAEIQKWLRRPHLKGTPRHVIAETIGMLRDEDFSDL